jgi:hypothetical protein
VAVGAISGGHCDVSIWLTLTRVDELIGSPE